MEGHFFHQGLECIGDHLRHFLAAHKITLYIRGKVTNRGMNEATCTQLLESLVRYRAALCPYGGEILLECPSGVGKQNEQATVVIISHTLWFRQEAVGTLRTHEKKQILQKLRLGWEQFLDHQSWHYEEKSLPGGVLWGKLKVPVSKRPLTSYACTEFGPSKKSRRRSQ